MAVHSYVDSFGYVGNITTMNGAEFHYSILDEAPLLKQDQESEMHSSVEGSTPKITIGAVKVLGGWAGQILVDNEVIWQSNKLRNHKEDKYGNIYEGSDRAVIDARKHRIKTVKKQYAS